MHNQQLDGAGNCFWVQTQSVLESTGAFTIDICDARAEYMESDPFHTFRRLVEICPSSYLSLIMT